MICKDVDSVEMDQQGLDQTLVRMFGRKTTEFVQGCVAVSLQKIVATVSRWWVPVPVHT